jgi:hypothetical protein
MFAVLLLAGCGSATHAVGQIEAESEIAPRPRTPPAGTAGSGTGANTGSAGTFTAAAGTGSLSPGGAGGADPDVTCGTSPLPAHRQRLELYLMVDSNINIPNINPWTTLLAGLSNYVIDARAAGTGVALDFFTLSCDAATYARPEVPMAPLPENAEAIDSALRTFDFNSIINSSAMQPALEGAVRYTKSRAFAYPDIKQAIVFLTDGVIDIAACGTTPDGLANAAASGLASPASVPTYVLAVDVPNLGDLLNPFISFGSLDLIASQGGTGQARHIDAQSAATELVDALLEIQLGAETCEVEIPSVVRNNPGRLRLGLAADPGEPQEALNELAGPADCGAGYTVNAEATWLTLCPIVCDDVKRNRTPLIWFSDC